MFTFQTNPLNRHGHNRHTSQFIRRCLQQANTRFLPVIRQSILSIEDADGKMQPLLLKQGELESVISNIETKHLIYLGEMEQQHYFTFRLKSKALVEGFAAVARHNNVVLTDLRQLFKHLSPNQAHLCNVAVALEHWHNTHQYCGVCGHATYATQSGFVRTCSNPQCETEHFPRTDSAVICAITHQDRLLLGRQKNWPEHLYSVIAGFVEPGETLEQAVAREAYEETGLPLSNIQYYQSQPWPFPQSLMVGFTAEANHDTVKLLDKELEHARWFTREEVRRESENGKLVLPFKYSISRTLVNQWLNTD
ncbi:NAD(+) diphosphatase [Kangiella shandongensis]|uniref:NAD(+) diphosphatase n=1 Tax=Kangiella shandongensis TaxID=2763258 RepID=UPI001CBEBCBC|nr:NAD(+) diphosphatase [Kangiella shandongensis]